MARRISRGLIWGWLRWTLGMLQMMGAVVSLVLLYELGVTPVSLSFVVGTTLCTTLSVVLFGSRHEKRSSSSR